MFFSKCRVYAAIVDVYLAIQAFPFNSSTASWQYVTIASFVLASISVIATIVTKTRTLTGFDVAAIATPAVALFGVKVASRFTWTKNQSSAFSFAFYTAAVCISWHILV